MPKTIYHGGDVKVSYGEETGEGIFQDARKFFTGKYSGEKEFKKWVESNKDTVISSIVIYREPINSKIKDLLNIITLGKFKSAVKKVGYDELFHLSMVINNRWRVEKNSIVKVSENTNYPPETQKISVNVNKSVKIGDFFTKAISLMGERNFFTYDAFSTNCQHFIQNVLSSNGFLTPELDNFIYQNAGDILRNLPSYTASLSSTLTDLGSFIGAGLRGGGMTLPQVESELSKIKVESPLPKDDPNYPSVENAFRAWQYKYKFEHELGRTYDEQIAGEVHKIVNMGLGTVSMILSFIPEGQAVGEVLSTVNDGFDMLYDILGVPEDTSGESKVREIVEALEEWKEQYTPWDELSPAEKQKALDDGFDPVKAVKALNNQPQNRPQGIPSVDLPGLPNSRLKAKWDQLTQDQRIIFLTAAQNGPAPRTDYGKLLSIYLGEKGVGGFASGVIRKYIKKVGGSRFVKEIENAPPFAPGEDEVQYQIRTGLPPAIPMFLKLSETNPGALSGGGPVFSKPVEQEAIGILPTETERYKKSRQWDIDNPPIYEIDNSKGYPEKVFKGPFHYPDWYVHFEGRSVRRNRANESEETRRERDEYYDRIWQDIHKLRPVQKGSGRVIDGGIISVSF